jgi:hypothetical protein
LPGNCTTDAAKDEFRFRLDNWHSAQLRCGAIPT